MAAVDRASRAALAVTGANDADGEIVIFIAGELDASNVLFARREVDSLLVTDPASVVFDLSELSFMDSSGIALLVQVAARVKVISLRHVPALIQRVLEATGLSEVLGVKP
jgi:anti-sigma B factor antagonist